MSNELKRIPFNNWINSQLSVARHYGGIKINNDYYEYDREIVKKMREETDNSVLFKPDLVLYSNK